MTAYVLYVVGFVALLAIIASASARQFERSRRAEEETPQPFYWRVRYCALPCAGCGKALEDGNVCVTDGTDHFHRGCYEKARKAES